MDVKLLARIKDIAIRQGNRLQLIYCPHEHEWTVTIGMFTARAPSLNEGAVSVADQVDAYRSKQAS